MPDWTSEWLDQLSAGQLALVFCAFFVGITWLGILFVHPFMRRLLHRDEPSNEPIIHIAGNFGLFFAVLLGLLTIAAFENTKSLQDNISREASSLSTIYRSTDVYPEPLRSEVKAERRAKPDAGDMSEGGRPPPLASTRSADASFARGRRRWNSATRANAPIRPCAARTSSPPSPPSPSGSSPAACRGCARCDVRRPT